MTQFRSIDRFESSRGAVILRALVVCLSAQPAAAHFVWSRIETAPVRRIEVTFGEQPDEPTSAVPLGRLESARAWDAAKRPLALAPDATSLTAKLAAETRAVGVSQSWGIVDREGDGTGAFLLEYYAKAAATLEGAKDSVGLPLEVFVERDGEKLVAKVRRGDIPVENASVHVHLPSGGTLDLKSDAQGIARIEDVRAGVYGIRARWLEDRTGDVGGKPYGEVRHYSTLTFPLPEQATVPASAPASASANSKEPARAANPAAYALLKDAHDSRQVMPADYPGFRCDLVFAEGDKSWKGTLVYRRREDPTIQFDGLDADSIGWVRRQILNVVGHRRGGDFAEGDGRYPLEFAPEDGNDFGRLILLHDATDSRYRVRDNKVLEVTRTMDGSCFTISVIDTMEADTGKYLAHHFLVSYRDPESDALQKVEGYRDSYARVEGIWLPTSRTIFTVAGETTPQVRSLRLTKHQKLSDEGTVAR